MDKIDSKTETIFSHAVALEQSGRLRNTIYAGNKEVFILNSDSTVIIRFKSPSKFKNPISFKASDYESKSFYEKDGKIIFVTKGDGMIREKSCKTLEMDYGTVKSIFDGLDLKVKNKIVINKSILPLLDENLSHIEISSEKKALKITQRNIYDGTVIDITKEKSKGFGVSAKDEIKKDISPIGMRTNDFMALFAFNNEVEFQLSSKKGYCYFKGRNFNMKGILALCLYDELGTIKDNSKPVKSKRKRRRK